MKNRQPRFSDLFVFAWESLEPRWRQEANKHMNDIVEETGLPEEDVEEVLEALERYKILV